MKMRPIRIAFVGVAVEFERVGQEVVDVDKSAVGVVAVGLDVGVLPDEVVGAELEDVGVHLEDQDVVGDLQLGFELAAVAVFEAHAAVEFAVQFVVHLRGHLQQRLLQGVERSEGVVENPLFECRLADDGVENLCSQRGCFHVCRFYFMRISRPCGQLPSLRSLLSFSIDRVRMA